MDRGEQRHHLIEGLVGDAHRHAYVTSATFYASINALANMLPLWVDGLASQAAEADADIQQRIDLLTRTIGPVSFPGIEDKGTA